ncbi:hypothetical protein RJ639_023545 [Escallonia herrerae]|uniref:Reverse transcriptase Ty1/copia-type domain-containing protein n=1 Tax=Escallonia herrerae TaxID=1293975 RepID=A0AA88UZS1_9ASTE|nr:hypothetical protein RJ639_023545 [Escallonia herrerae]
MDTWPLDSGCIFDESIFQELDTAFNFKVKLGNDALIDVTCNGNGETMIQEFKEDIMKKFEMSDLGLMHHFLGIEISQEKEDKGRLLDQVYGFPEKPRSMRWVKLIRPLSRSLDEEATGFPLSFSN